MRDRLKGRKKEVIMPYGKIVEEIRRKVENGEIDPVEAEAFERELDTYGLCLPGVVCRVTGRLRDRKLKVGIGKD